MNGLTPDMIQQLLTMGDDNPQAQQIRRQQAFVDMLRQNAMRPQQTQMAGRVALPNWGNAIGQLGQGYAALRMQPQIDTQAQQLHERNARARQGYGDALFMSLRRNKPQPQGPVLPPDGYEDQ